MSEWCFLIFTARLQKRFLALKNWGRQFTGPPQDWRAASRRQAQVRLCWSFWLYGTQAGAIWSMWLGPTFGNLEAFTCGPLSASWDSFGIQKEAPSAISWFGSVAAEEHWLGNVCSHKKTSILGSAMKITEKSVLKAPLVKFQMAYIACVRYCWLLQKILSVMTIFVVVWVCIPTAMRAVL